MVETVVIDAKDLGSVKRGVESVGEIDHLVFTSGDHLRIADYKSADIGKMKGALFC